MTHGNLFTTYMSYNRKKCQKRLHILFLNSKINILHVELVIDNIEKILYNRSSFE